MQFEHTLPKIAGRKLTLSFIPATPADEQLIASFLPQPNSDGSPIRPDQLPQSLPGYLLRLKAELRINGQVAATATGIVSMGDMLAQRIELYDPARGWAGGEDIALIAGEYNALMIDGQGVAGAQLQIHQQKLQATKDSLTQHLQNPNDFSPIISLTKEDLIGDILYSGVLDYFASEAINEALTQAASQRIIAHRFPSYGRFFTFAQPHLFFGIVRSVTFPAVAIDIPFIRTLAEAKDGDVNTRITFFRQTGVLGSAAEHQVPEQLFRDPNKPDNDPSQPQGISTVKALAIAAAQGQKIYTLTTANTAIHAPVLASLNISADAKQDIANALATGKEVTVHEADIMAYGFQLDSQVFSG